MSETRDSKIPEPKEVAEMRAALVAFRKAARGVKDSQRGLPRVSGRLVQPRLPPEQSKSVDPDDEITKKMLVPA